MRGRLEKKDCGGKGVGVHRYVYVAESVASRPPRCAVGPSAIYAASACNVTVTTRLGVRIAPAGEAEPGGLSLHYDRFLAPLKLLPLARDRGEARRAVGGRHRFSVDGVGSERFLPRLLLGEEVGLAALPDGVGQLAR